MADGTPVPATYHLVDQAAEIGHDIAVEMSVGDELTVEKIVTLFTGRDVATSEPAVDAQRWLSRLGRFAELRDGHLNAWAHLWERLSIEFEDFTDESRILRLHLLHLLQTVSPNSATSTSGYRPADSTVRHIAGTSSGTSCSSSRCSTCGCR